MGDVALAEGADKKKHKGSKRITSLASSRIYISASYNNTLISVTDSNGNMLVWSSAGAMGFKGPKKATPFAASRVVENITLILGRFPYMCRA